MGDLFRQRRQTQTAVSPIWSLRRGDADDDRASPYARGFFGILISAALNFNFLKGALSFLVLIVGPALLVGVVPSIVVTFGLLKLRAATLLGRNPVAALLLLIVLVGVALWIGRPLLASAINHFWHLHYTLIFPIFIALRELMRSAVERLFHRSITPERLHRQRQFGAVLAALLLTAGGIALATSVEISMGVQVVDIAHVRLRAVAWAALANAAVILGLSTAIESSYWLWRELKLGGPALDWESKVKKNESSTIRVAHLSDLHLVGERYGYRMETGTHGPRGNRSVRHALRRLEVLHQMTPLDRILLTGDVTDAGTRAEWAEFVDLLRNHPELRTRLSFVPGNHDVNIVDRANPGHLDLPWSPGLALRKLRVVLALDAIQGNRAHVVDHASGTLGPLLRDYLRENSRAELLRALAQSATARGRRAMATLWNEIFPLVEPGPEGCDYGVILLDSNARSHFSLTNAIGVVDPPQLKALKSVLRNDPGRAWLILLHHQIVEYPVASIGLRDRIGLALINASEVLSAIKPYASRILVLHGHRHRDWIGTCGDVVLCSAPSVTLGSHEKKDYRGSFHVHELVLGTGAGIRLATTERVHIA